MKQLGEFVKTTLISGLLVLFPLFASIYVIVLIIGFLTSLIKPLLQELVPESRHLLGITLLNAATILLLIGSCLVVGLVARTRIGATLAHSTSRLLNAIPGYRMFVRVARILFDRNDASGTPVVVQRDDSRRLGFMMEEIGNEEVVVFFPEAPGVVSGTVEIIKASLVERLNVPAVRVARVIATYGAGIQPLLTDTVNNKKSVLIDPHHSMAQRPSLP